MVGFGWILLFVGCVGSTLAANKIVYKSVQIRAGKTGNNLPVNSKNSAAPPDRNNVPRRATAAFPSSIFSLKLSLSLD